MNRKELAKSIFETSHITGKFLLRSGQTSTEYFDKYLFESQPILLKAIAEQMEKIVPENTEILAGLEMGGIPLSTALSFRTNKPSIFVRKTAKEYGTMKLAEGTAFAGKNVTIIEDVVTTGGQIIKSAAELRKLGAVIKNVMCVIVRDPVAFEKLKEAGLNLIPLFTMEELKEVV